MKISKIKQGIPEEATMEAYGDISTDAHTYSPLDKVSVKITGSIVKHSKCLIRVYDGNLKLYHEAEAKLIKNKAVFNFTAAGALGVHWIYLYYPGSKHHSRYLNFVLDAETKIETGNSLYDNLYSITKENLQLGRREFLVKEGKFAGYISGDTWQINGIWLRDWIYQCCAYKYWEKEMTCGLDRFLEKQNTNGSLPDGIRRDGSTWRMSVESDIEYIIIFGVFYTWQVTGDNKWMKNALPKVEKALKYIQKDKFRWDKEHDLVKRGHTCDTWDFEIGETSDFVGKRFVVATCDQSGYYLGYQMVSKMYAVLNNKARAGYYSKLAGKYRTRANKLLWDGIKYRHHFHLTDIKHPGFDESKQLAMGNVWAITRTLANQKQAVSIIQEYAKRQKETGDAFPWWSLQPGYPDELKYFKNAYCKQGGYANGGLMPFVGGELSFGSFENGMESYGLKLYKQYIEHLRKTGNKVHVWYWTNGKPGFRTTNEVPYTGWGMAQWLQVLIEGIAGIKDTGTQLETVTVSPRWAVTNEKSVKAIVRYAANNSYFAYQMKVNPAKKEITLNYTGSGKKVTFRILLYKAWSPKIISVNGKKIKFKLKTIESSKYACF
ncbi:MAG: hypothetical protein A2231_11725 [Candidatus Firestonebacteria bacterium RIFOXYA2_FULL_40_8]|nr:MAG: hypothetical protein A2231_11725 [Candidatus Firestonebacteria bacterium RIFOXYA2_FULL_40_8]